MLLRRHGLFVLMHTNGRNHHHNRGEPLLELPHVPVVVQPPHPARPAMKRWASLGVKVHYETHLMFERAEKAPDFPLPSPTSVSFFSPSGNQRAGPSESLVDAIDKRAGVHDIDLARAEAIKDLRRRLYNAMERLREFDATLQDLVLAACIEGEAMTLPGSGLRHIGRRFHTAVSQLFDEDVRKCEYWLDKAWEFLAIELATPRALEEALRQGAVWKRAYDWLTDIPFE